MCCLCLCNLRNPALELTLQNFVNLCNQRPPECIRMHQIRFAPRLRPDPAGGAHNAPPDPVVGWGGETPSPYPVPPYRTYETPSPYPSSTPSASRSRRLWRLGPGAFGACFAPNLFFVPARLYKSAIFPRTIPVWNALPVELVVAESLQAFKLRL